MWTAFRRTRGGALQRTIICFKSGPCPTDLELGSTFGLGAAESGLDLAWAGFSQIGGGGLGSAECGLGSNETGLDWANRSMERRAALKHVRTGLI